MKLEAIISLAMLTAFAIAKSEDSPELPSPSPSTSEMEEPALPTPETAPSNPGPGLLPESGELPAHVPHETPPKLSASRESTLHSAGNGERFDEIQSLATRNPHAAYLLKRARSSSNSASRRAYLREYYVTVAARMRKLDPKLDSSINAYEEAKIHEVSATKSSTARTSHRSRSRRTANREVHHRLHKVSYENRYGRMIIMGEPYGPYGPVILPYPPPAFFDPW